MKKSSHSLSSAKTNKLALHHDIVRVLTTHELNLVWAGNCLKGSHVSNTDPTRMGVC